jgi:hypothetical protein
MFGLFKKREKEESVRELDRKYRMLMHRWHKLSGIDREAGQKVYEQAQAVLKQIILKKAV